MHSYNPLDPRRSTIQSTHGSNVNLPRRHYKIAPQDVGKNEWRSLVRHYQDVDQKTRLMEQYAKQAFQQKMREDLQVQIDQRESSKLERNQKRRNYENGMLQRDQFEAEKALTNKIAERKTVKNYLNNEYSRGIEEKRAAEEARVTLQSIKFHPN